MPPPDPNEPAPRGLQAASILLERLEGAELLGGIGDRRGEGAEVVIVRSLWEGYGRVARPVLPQAPLLKGGCWIGRAFFLAWD